MSDGMQIQSQGRQRKRVTKRLLTHKEAAEYLGIAAKTLWEWVNRGIIPQVKFPGSNPKYDIVDIEMAIEENKSYSEAAIVLNKVNK